MQDVYRTSMGYLASRRGTEGPRHDPYSFTETTFVRGTHKVIYHGGLAEWVQIDGVKYADDPYAKFKEATGYTVYEIERIMDRAECRRYRRIPHYAEMIDADAAMLRYARG